MSDDSVRDDSIRYWHDLTAPEVEGGMDADPLVVLPMGAVEQHGPHLPLSTDVDIATGILARAFRELSDDFPARALPPLVRGASAEHLDLPGTLSQEPELLVRVVVEQGRAVARCGVRRLLLFSGHGGNRAAMEMAGLRLRREEGLLVIRTSPFDLPRPRGLDLPAEEWRHGLHGGAVETAMMLHLRPDRVRMGRAARFPSLGEELEQSLDHVGPTGSAPFSWLATDLHPSGAVGDPRLASPEAGERLVRHYGTVLAEVMRDARAFPLERLR